MLSGTEPDHLGPFDQIKIDFETTKRFINIASKGLVEITWNHDDYYLDSEGYHGSAGSVQFILQSVVDFLNRDHKLAWLDPTLDADLVGTSHDRLVSCCMAYMMQEELKSQAREMYSEFESKTTPSGMTQVYPFLEYATERLLYHAWLIDWWLFAISCWICPKEKSLPDRASVSP